MWSFDASGGISIEPRPGWAVDTWVADLLDKPEKKRAESLYELLLHLKLSMSHLEGYTYERRRSIVHTYELFRGRLSEGAEDYRLMDGRTSR